jgi:HEXXH motif-containing protein
VAELSRKLRTILGERGWTQEVLAKELGVSFMSVNSWINERSQPRSSRMRAIDGLFAQLAIATSSSARRLYSNDDRGSEAVTTATGTTAERVAQLFNTQHPMHKPVLQAGQYLKLLQKLANITANARSSTILDAVILLDAAKDRNDKACMQALLYPLVSQWMATCERTLLTGDEQSFQHHLAHFTTVAGVAAWRSGVSDFSIEVPVRDAAVHLPGLGRVELVGGSAPTALLQCTDSRLFVVGDDISVEIPVDPARQAEHWQPIRRVDVEHDGVGGTWFIDDLDPYRLAGQTIPEGFSSERLDDVSFKEWQERMQDAWATLVQWHRLRALDVAACMSVIVPIRYGIAHATASDPDGFGAILTTVGVSPTWFAAGLVEESERSKVDALHTLSPLHTDSANRTEYLVPYYPEVRPLHNLLSTFSSSAAVAEVWAIQHRIAAGAEQFEAAVNWQLRRQWAEVLLDLLVDCGELTEFGASFVEHIKQRTLCEPQHAPADVVELARNMGIDRRVCGRLTNLTCSHDDIARLGRAWMNGMACPTAHPVRLMVQRGRPALMGWKRRRQLAELRATHIDAFDAALESDHYLHLVAPTSEPGDALAVAGMFSDASTRFEAAITADRDDAEAWGGLAYIAARSGLGAGAVATLGRFPEIVRTLHQHLLRHYDRIERPLVLAEWLAPLLLRMDETAYEMSGDA